MDIATGTAQDHRVLQSSSIPATARPTEVVPGQLSGPTIPARDTVGEYAAQMAAAEADCRAAQSAGMAATGRRTSYAADMMPLGASYGYEMTLPLVPANAVPPASSDLYPWQGDEPVPAG